jgi:enolase
MTTIVARSRAGDPRQPLQSGPRGRHRPRWRGAGSGVLAGTREAVELPEAKRGAHLRRGVRKAVEAVNGEITGVIHALDAVGQVAVDAAAR